jgi:phosphoglycolate phosphatase
VSNYKTVIFDLDGTLLDTLEDLKISVNYALIENGLKGNYSSEEIKYFVGNGVDVLITRALMPFNKIELHEQVKSSYRRHYINSKYINTKPYPGMIEVLTKIKKMNIFLGVLSNKPNLEAKEIIYKNFPNIFNFVQGGIKEEPHKPNPKMLNQIILNNNLKKEEILYIGDTDVDLQLANNAGIDCAIVTWGFRKPEEVGKPKYFINKANEILNIIGKI